jgi:signal transduction histidine kinase/ligand-binding sensor domain-containing protein
LRLHFRRIFQLTATGCLSLCACIIFSSPAIAQPIKRLTHITYNVNEGLMQSQVNSIAEDGNGFIWTCTNRGIQRFDGRSFQLVPLDDKRISFFNLQNGNLLLCSPHQVNEYDARTNRIQQLVEYKDNPTENSITAASEDKDKLWLLVPGKGLCTLDKQTHALQQKVNVPGEETIYHIPYVAPALTGDEIFIAWKLSTIYLINKINQQIDSVKPNAGQFSFYTIIKYNTDTALVATGRGIELFNCRTKQFEVIAPYKTNPLSVNRLHPVYMLKADEQTIIVSEGKELFTLDMRSRQYSNRLINLQNQSFTEVGYITGIISDSHGNIWLTTENNGICKINYRFAGFRYFGDKDRKNNFIKTIYVDKPGNRVLCGTFGTGLQVFDTSQQLLHSIRNFPGLVSPATACAFRKIAPHQYLVFAMGSWDVFLLNTQTWSFSKITTNTSSIHTSIRETRMPDYHLTVHTVSDSVMLMQSGFNAFRIVWKQSQLSITPTNTFELATISSYVDPSNRWWIGCQGGYYLADKNFTNFQLFRLPRNIMARCFYQQNNNHTWMGTDKGLYLLDEKGDILRTLRSEDGLPDENIYAIRKDAEGNCWFTHNKGMTCLRPNGSMLHFNRTDGLQENEFNTNTSFETPDGELFFGGVNGASSFYPSLISNVKEKPEVLLTGIKVKDQPWMNDTAYWSLDKLELPYYNNSFSFNLTAIGNRTADQYNYQYQLLNQDAEWVNAGNNPQVRYVLQPGRYVFRYYAANSFDPSPANAKEILIVISPPFWKTAWFIGLMIVLLAASTILITRYISQLKLRRRINELERKRMMDEERLRISREMHDDIGAGLTQITLISEAAKQSAENKSPLTEIADTSRRLVGSMSEIIWSLNPEHNTLDQLFSYLREQLNKLLEYSGAQYSISFPENNHDVLLNNAQRRNLLLVTKEIVHNAIKHSQAKKIIITCTLEGKHLKFSIQDDGRGFDPQQKTKGNGLRNIRRRIEELQGQLEIESSVAGTLFKYTLPV